ncbi:polysaccharide pyruvyl transferase family protein [Nesterenkonia aurantiaca]|uniref:Polysaccharide pyruvyl transferase n=1 Tax=Nesterenkonia aurantiaca TaxID=1436010 RepID=A0A4V3EBK1_9MICC|nr:polysaccharide pyruvyl transferase family protein [Nesterenkonia aurantiaca]TDS82632.1 polysaccharide pyruvyl transferase [Nesterenkonia aurantiaca]
MHVRVLVLWADTRSANLGVQVLAHGMAALIRQAWGEDVVVDFQDYGTGDSEIGFGERNILADLGRRDGVLKRKLRQYDLIVDSGAGDSFTDIYGLRRLAWMYNAHRLSAGLGVPVALGPQTVGPFNTRLGRAMGRSMLQNAAQVHVRDGVSATYAEDELNVVPDAKSTDVVFALPQPTSGQHHDVLLNVSGLLWQPNNHVDSARYRSLIFGLISGLKRQGRTVTLLSHVIENPRPDNDAPVSRELGDELGLNIVIPKSLEHARAAVGSAQLVIGSRMHACLNALSTGTPSIPLAYSRKFAPLMADIGWPHVFDLRRDEELIEPLLETVVSMQRTDNDEVDVLRARARARLETSVEALKRLR